MLRMCDCRSRCCWRCVRLSPRRTALAVALAQYQHETDPVRKARELAKLGDDQIDLARKQLKAGDDVASLHTLEQYRDEVQRNGRGD